MEWGSKNCFTWIVTKSLCGGLAGTEVSNKEELNFWTWNTSVPFFLLLC